MKATKAFLKQVSKSGLYIILFLCICVTGIAGYVMYRTDETEIPVDEILKDVPKPVIEEYVPIEIPEEEEPDPVVNEEPVIKEEPLEFISAVKGSAIAPFSGEELVKSKTFNDWRTHNGIDFAAEEGATVCAIARGVVEKVYEDEMMGHTVVISHDEEITSIYSNLKEDVSVKIGQKVKGGEKIGVVGKSAVAEEGEISHLHLETTKNGEQIDPMSLIK